MRPHHVALPVPCVPVRLHTVLWLLIGILISLLAAEPRSTTGLLLPSLYLCEMINFWSCGGKFVLHTQHEVVFSTDELL